MGNKVITKKKGVEAPVLISTLTVVAWIVLAVGIVLCFFKLEYFSDRNEYLMIGIGCLISSVFIYMIRTALHLANAQHQSNTEDQ